MTEEQIKEKNRIERQLDKLVKQEENLSRRLHILSFPDTIKHVEDSFETDYNGYTIVIEKGDRFNIKTRFNELSRCEVVFVLPNEYTSKLMDILKVAADNEIFK